MQHVFLLLFHLVTSLGTLLRPGGIKALVAENLLLRQQLLILRRSRRRSPNLRTQDRLFLGLWSLFVSPRRLMHTAILVKPSTLLRCHRALTELKLRWLYSSSRKRKPGPKGPTAELIQSHR